MPIKSAIRPMYGRPKLIGSIIFAQCNMASAIRPGAGLETIYAEILFSNSANNVSEKSISTRTIAKFIGVKKDTVSVNQAFIQFSTAL